MATKTVITLERLTKYDELIKSYIDTADTASIKTIVLDTSGNTNVLKFYRTSEPLAPGATPAYSIDLPDTDISGLEADVEALEELIGTIPTHEEGGEQVPDADSIVEYIVAKFTAATSASVVTMVTSTAQDTPSGMYKTYTFKQGPAGSQTTIGTVNVPVDLVVESGSVVHPTQQDPITIDGQTITSGTYLCLVIANQTDPVYINVVDLVDTYTVETNATQVQLAISNTDEISATLVDGGVTKAKLSSALQGSIDAIDDIQYATEAQITALFSSGS